jgi:F-type H+-transporting ATPase subunit gamma
VAALSATSAGEVDDGKPGIDELWVIYTRFVNSVTQTPTAAQVSPVKAATDDDQPHDSADDESDKDEQAERDNGGLVEFEPEPARLIEALLPRYISSRIFSALLESAASESAARRRAMKSASDNATELITTYTRLANQARQAEITQEISEIVGGADALAAAGSE